MVVHGFFRPDDLWDQFGNGEKYRHDSSPCILVVVFSLNQFYRWNFLDLVDFTGVFVPSAALCGQLAAQCDGVALCILLFYSRHCRAGNLLR